MLAADAVSLVLGAPYSSVTLGLERVSPDKGMEFLKVLVLRIQIARLALMLMLVMVVILALIPVLTQTRT